MTTANNKRRQSFNNDDDDGDDVNTAIRRLEGYTIRPRNGGNKVDLVINTVNI